MNTNHWSEHFDLQVTPIQPLTTIGEVTARILGFNDSDRRLERQLLIQQHKYPSLAALKRMEAKPSQNDH